MPWHSYAYDQIVRGINLNSPILPDIFGGSCRREVDGRWVFHEVSVSCRHGCQSSGRGSESENAEIARCNRGEGDGDEVGRQTNWGPTWETRSYNSQLGFLMQTLMNEILEPFDN